MTADPFTPDRRSWLRILVAVMVGAVLAFAVRGCGRGSASSVSRPVAARGTGPRGVVAGIPVGFGRTREGARAAAAAYVTTGQTMLDAGSLTAGDAVRVMAARRTADAQVDDLLARLAALQAKLASGTGPVRYRQAILATRIERFTRDRVRVAVWSVGVLSRRGVAAPQAGWSMSTFDLVWERGDWKVAAERVRSGPTPMLDLGAHPSTPSEFAAQLRGFRTWPGGAGS